MQIKRRKPAPYLTWHKLHSPQTVHSDLCNPHTYRFCLKKLVDVKLYASMPKLFLTLCLWQSIIDPNGSSQSYHSIQPEGPRAPEVLYEGQKRLADDSICYPITRRCCTTSQPPQLHAHTYQLDLDSFILCWLTPALDTFPSAQEASL